MFSVSIKLTKILNGIMQEIIREDNYMKVFSGRGGKFFTLLVMAVIMAFAMALPVNAAITTEVEATNPTLFVQSDYTLSISTDEAISVGESVYIDFNTSAFDWSGLDVSALELTVAGMVYSDDASLVDGVITIPLNGTIPGGSQFEINLSGLFNRGMLLPSYFFAEVYTDNTSPQAVYVGKVPPVPAAIALTLDTDNNWSVNQRGKVTVSLMKSDGSEFTVPSELTDGMHVCLNSNKGLFYTAMVGGISGCYLKIPAGSVSADVYYAPMAGGVNELYAEAGSCNVYANTSINVSSEGLFSIFSTYLEEGWNTLSTPVLLENGYNTLGQVVDNTGKIDLVYSYDEIAGLWNLIYEDGGKWFTGTGDSKIEFKLMPQQAIFVHLAEGYAEANFFASTKLSAPPARNLVPGWNFIGPAIVPYDNNNRVDNSLFSIDGKYSQVLSPAAVNQRPWTYVPNGNTKNKDISDLRAGRGYWVYMTQPGTLAGFTSTPMYFDYDYYKTAKQAIAE